MRATADRRACDFKLQKIIFLNVKMITNLLIVVDELAEFDIENSIDFNKFIFYPKRYVFNNIFCSNGQNILKPLYFNCALISVDHFVHFAISFNATLT